MLGYDYLASQNLSIVFDHEKKKFQLISVPFVQHEDNIDNTK